MPNIVGGDQFHPSYDPRTKIEENQVLVGTVLYEIEILPNDKIRVSSQDVSEMNSSYCPESLYSVIKEVMAKIEELKNKK